LRRACPTFWNICCSWLVRQAELARRRHQHVEDAVLGGILGLGPQLAHLAFARLLDRDVHQVADDAVHVAADVTDLGELGCLDLDERRIGQPCQAPRDLGLAHAGGADHEDVLWSDLCTQRLGDVAPAPAVAQCNGHRALGLVLADDVLVQFGDDLFGGHHVSSLRVYAKCSSQARSFRSGRACARMTRARGGLRPRRWSSLLAASTVVALPGGTLNPESSILNPRAQSITSMVCDWLV